jgi:hypothetical protein
MDIEQSF